MPTKNTSRGAIPIIFVIVLVLVGAGLWLLSSQGKLPSIPYFSVPRPTSEPVSQECGVCGPKGIHNVSGAQCAPGLICKSGEATSLSFCVKEDESVSRCEKTANWKTYTYKNVFLFKYPREMELIEHSGSLIQVTNQEPKSINLPTPSDSKCTGDCVSISFLAGSLGEKSFKDFVIKEYEKSKSGTTGDKPPTKISINETEGYSYIIGGFANYKAIYLPVENNSYISIITSVDPQPVVNQILSTLRLDSGQ